MNLIGLYNLVVLDTFITRTGLEQLWIWDLCGKAKEDKRNKEESCEGVKIAIKSIVVDNPECKNSTKISYFFEVGNLTYLIFKWIPKWLIISHIIASKNSKKKTGRNSSKKSN